MYILWITNVLFPEAEALLTGKSESKFNTQEDYSKYLR